MDGPDEVVGAEVMAPEGSIHMFCLSFELLKFVSKLDALTIHDNIEKSDGGTCVGSCLNYASEREVVFRR